MEPEYRSPRHPLSLPAVENLAQALEKATGWRLARYGADAQPIGGQTDQPADPSTSIAVVIEDETIGYLRLLPKDLQDQAAGLTELPAAGLLEAVADLLASWIGALRAARDNDEQLTSLSELTRLLGRTARRAEILAAVCETAWRSLEAEFAVLWLRDDYGRYHVAAVYPDTVSRDLFPSFDLTDNSVDAACQRGETLLIEDPSTDPRVSHWPSVCRQRLGSALVAGITSVEAPIGCLHVVGRPGDRFSMHSARLLTAIADQAAISLVRDRLAEDQRTNESIRHDLTTASIVQAALLPKRIPTWPGVQFGHYFKPFSIVGGDLYDFIRINDHNLGLAIGDASGKGITGALMMATVRGGLHAYVEHVYHVTDIFRQLNETIYDTTRGEYFMTLFYGVLNIANMEFNFTNAGHNAPLHYHDGVCRELNTANTFLGAVPRVDYHRGTIALAPGDILFLYTDGLIESMNPEDEMYQKRRLIALIREYHARPAQELIDIVRADVEVFRRGRQAYDDMTLVAVKILDHCRI